LLLRCCAEWRGSQTAAPFKLVISHTYINKSGE
jgi:hypothetical protein